MVHHQNWLILKLSCVYNNIMCLWPITEINECQDGNSSCEQVCVNTIGSYECGCYEGYRLSQDGFTCIGS